MGALDIQVGGTHYKECAYQPVKFCADLNLNFFQGNIVKYITRYKDKNGREDLEKVIHYAQIGDELQPRNFVTSKAGELIIKYTEANSLSPLVSGVIRGAVFQNWNRVINGVTRIIEQEYETVH